MARSGSGDRGSVRTRLRFGEAEGAQYFSMRQTRKIFLLLRFAAVLENREDGERIRDAQRHGHRGVHSRHLFEHHNVGNRVAAKASPGFGDEHAATAEFTELPE